nr:hypothetical protein [Tanacetum cinerariifolium]
MDSQSASVVSAAKLPNLNPNEVAVNGVAQPVTVLTAEQKLARKNELKACGTLLMALPDKHQLKFNSHKDAKTLMEAIEKHVNLKFLRNLPSEWKTHTLIWRNKANLEEHSLDDMFNSLKIYETKVRHSSSPSNLTQNLAFVSSSNTDSTTDSVSAATSVSAVCAKLPGSSHPNIDSLSNVVIFSFFASQSTNPQLDNEDLKQIDVDDLKEIDLRWQMAMLTIRARRFLQKKGRNLGDNRVTTMGFDMSKVECYNCHRKGHFARECRSPKDTRRTGVAELHRKTAPVETSTSNSLVSQCECIRSYDWSYQAEEEPANFALMAIPSSSSSDNEENIIVLKNEVEARDNFILTLKRKLKQAETKRDDLKLKFKKFQSSFKSLTELIACQTNNKHGVGYLSLEDDFESVSLTYPSDRLSLSGGYHAIPPPITGNFMPPKLDLVFNTAPLDVESDHLAFNVQPIEIPILAATPKPTIQTSSSGKRKNRKTCFVCRSMDHLIKDLLPKSKPVSVTAVRQVNAAVSKIMKSRPRHAHPLNKKSNPSIISAVKGKKGKWVWRPKCPILDHDSRTTELNGGYVAFGGNPKGGKISRKGKIKTYFKHPDESQVLLRVPRENNMYNVFFLATKDETSPILKSFITGLENQLSLKVKVIRSDNGTEFKNSDLNQFCELKGIKREFSVPRTPQQNGIAERKNRTLIEAARIMLADSLLSIPFWAEAVNTACYVQNRVLVTKPQKKTPYELLHGRTPRKFQGKVDEGFLVGYSVNSKAFRVFNNQTRIVQETLHVNFLENKPNVTGTGPLWLFDIDSLTRTMNYQPVTAGNQSNPSTGFQEEFREEANQQYLLFPVWSTGSTNPQNKEGDATFDGNRDFNAVFDDFSKDSSNDVSAASPIVPTAGQNYSNSTNPISVADTYLPPDMVEREDIVYSDHENVGAEADFNNLETSITEELLQFKMQKVWILVDFPHGKRAIGIDYEEVFAPVARIEAIRLFLAYASFMGFMVYQMDVKRVFLYGTIEKDVYVCQPLGFEDPDHPDKVYKMVKALYGLHLAPRAWYETLATYLLENGFHRGQRDQALFIKKQKGNILLVQIYVDDIIFGATNKDLCKSFEKLMKDKFQMSSIGELTFFLGLQVKQKEDGIFINQDKYVAEILKKFGLTKGKSASTPIDTDKPLLKDPDVKRIFRYLKGKPNLGLWYPKDSPFDLVAYSDSDYAGASLDRNSTTGRCQFLGSRLISWQCKKQTIIATSSTEAEYVAGASCCAQVLWIQNQMLDYGDVKYELQRKRALTLRVIRPDKSESINK